MTDLAFSQWAHFFEDLEEFEKLRRQDIKQGKNDFNLLGSVLSVNDEVRLHTRFLYALLNPKSRHYQGTRFLELFLACIGREGWLNTDAVEVRKEFCPAEKSEQIDLFLSDGNRQIVIENKLNAKDQEGQVKRYLKAVGATSGETAENTLFIYLTKSRKQPSPNALRYPKKGGLPPDPEPLQIYDYNGQTVIGTRGAQDEPWALYQNLHYRHRSGAGSIHSWLAACEVGLASSPNLLWAIQDYRAAVERATREYVSNVKSLKAFLEEKGTPCHRLAIQLAMDLKNVHADWLDAAMTVHLDELFQDAIESGAVTRLSESSAQLFQCFLSKNVHANDLLYQRKFNFFGNRKNTKNRGAFFLIRQGAYADKVVLFLFYGVTMLHVGYSRLSGSGEGSALGGVLSSPSKLKKSVFSEECEVQTLAENMETKGIVSLADFEKSRQKMVLEQLLKVFV